ncbi:hypothetical protein BJ508DRAFT_141543 [Ascobolus immersus RN42]|uniref:Uncharacterized protein n=1 Tax=Ascobolus immersus RN42 TaxID=1160509 RepID=A0A3N4I250_ASCIM|nr:hypothetical protein BJ508DRAFT_141543 [Ascobolus immersus RN42]
MHVHSVSIPQPMPFDPSALFHLGPNFLFVSLFYAQSALWQLVRIRTPIICMSRQSERLLSCSVGLLNGGVVSSASDGSSFGLKSTHRSCCDGVAFHFHHQISI